MAKLYLKDDQAVMKEFALSEAATTIGRLPDNTVQIESLAVSGHHCRIVWNNDHYVIEDNNSLNGTYVNNQRVNKAALKDDDQILIGKQTLHFSDAHVHEHKTAHATVAATQGMEGTVAYTPNNPKTSVQTATSATAATPAHVRTGMLTVLDGKTDEREYTLTSKLTVIGKSDMASIKLKGWFAPKVAANVMKREAKYVIAAADKDQKVKINGDEVSGQHELSEGDLVEIAGITMQFKFKE
jgi:predicted component of type VI protein secretion system